MKSGSKSLRRKTPLKRKRPSSRGRVATRTTRTTRRSSRVRDEVYLARVRELPCSAPWLALPAYGDTYDYGIRRSDPCKGRIHAHHAGQRPLGRKASDYTAISLCAAHHDAWHSGSAPFKGWTRAARREWSDYVIRRTQETLGYRRAP